MNGKATYQSVVLSALVALSSGCSSPDDSTDSSSVPEAAPAEVVKSDIVFRGKYFLSKECRRGPQGEYALGVWGVCEVDEVIEGDLNLKLLKNVHVPEDVVEGRIYTFRWQMSDSDKEDVRKAREGGFTGIWLDDVTLELIGSDKPDH